MKNKPFFAGLICLVVLSACRTTPDYSEEVVCETVHRYGVPLDPDDWSDRGENGQVISVRKDGVSVTRSYDGGVLHGESTYSFPNRDVVQNREMYHQGVLIQETSHYPSGNPRQQTNYESPQKKSNISWYESGSPQAQEQYENGSLVHGEYYNQHHLVESRVDEANGQRTNRDGHGNLESIDAIDNGQFVRRTTYHPEGTPAAVTPYSQNVIEGERHTYSPTGEPLSVEQWSGNKQNGLTTFYEQGEKRADVPYVNGLKHGVETRYRADQAIAQEISWVKGQQHGPRHTYINDDKQTDWFFRGKQVPSKAVYDRLSGR